MASKYEPEAVVTEIYRAFFNANPDSAGLESRASLLRAGESIESLLRSFIHSHQFNATRVVALGRLERLPPNKIQSQILPTDMVALWSHIAKQWSKLGVDDPYWSVASSEEYRADYTSRPEVIDKFYDSGKHDLDRLRAYLERHERSLPAEGTCVDFGCGLGRVTLWLARYCRRVIACDVSAAHIDLARRNLATRGVRNVDFKLIRVPEDLCALDGADLFHSIIVLQHNPPPIIASILRAAFAGLASGGAAFFQVPTFGMDYSWSLESYRDTALPEGGFEMHMLSQGAIFALADEAGCVALEVQPDSCTGIPHWISNSFLFTKRSRVHAA